MTVRYRYNTQLEPPAPFVHATLGHTEQDVVISDMPAQLDTAADISVLPAQAVERLGLVPVEEIQVAGLGGNLVECPVYFVTVTLTNLPTITTRVLAHSDEPYVLLGRDVLNHFKIVLDGPRGVLDIE